MNPGQLTTFEDPPDRAFAERVLSVVTVPVVAPKVTYLFIVFQSPQKDQRFSELPACTYFPWKSKPWPNKPLLPGLGLQNVPSAYLLVRLPGGWDGISVDVRFTDCYLLDWVGQSGPLEN